MHFTGSLAYPDRSPRKHLDQRVDQRPEGSGLDDEEQSEHDQREQNRDQPPQLVVPDEGHQVAAEVELVFQGKPARAREMLMRMRRCVRFGQRCSA